MPSIPNLEANRLAWYNAGLAGGQFIGQGFDMALRASQQKAQDADRRIKEQLLAKELEKIELATQEARTEIAERARQDLEFLEVNKNISTQQMDYDFAKSEGYEGPAIDWTDVRKKAALGLALQGNKRAQAAVDSAFKAESAQALTQQRIASAELSEARRREILEDSEEMLPKLVEIAGRPVIVNPKSGRYEILDLDAVQKAKLESKLSIMRDVTKSINDALDERDSPQRTSKLQNLRRQREELEREINSFGTTPTAPTPAAPADPTAPPTVTTKAQFDALPSGTIYIGKDGRKYKKP